MNERLKNRTSKQKTITIDEWKHQMPRWLESVARQVQTGQTQQALKSLDQHLENGSVEKLFGTDKIFTMYEVANLFNQAGCIGRAEEIFKELLKIYDHAAVYNELGNIYKDAGRLKDAIRHYEIAIEKNPDEPGLWGNLGLCLMRLGRFEKAIELMKRAAERLADDNHVQSNLLLNMHYLPGVKRQEIYEQAKKWAGRNFPMALAKKDHANDPDPQRRLKVGYVSPDFRNHSVTYFFEPLLDAHRREAIEVYGYGNVIYHDQATERLKEKFDHYRNVRGLSDKKTAEVIASDQIDILVDLAGHSANSGIYAMGSKPAPVQVTWMGYPDTTGLSQVDYRITDEIADPAGAEKFHSEQLCYLPDGFLCFAPGEIVPAVSKSPCLERGAVTFGSFNNSAKINPLVIEMWSRILNAVPGASLLLKFKSADDQEIRQMYLERFAKGGVRADRIAFCGWVSDEQHLELYKHVDIALDTFPYNGTTTTCQALFMGVPVITLCGEHHMSRVGASILSRLGLEFFAAGSVEEYVNKAAALARDFGSLAKIRASMRQRMAISKLCNKTSFAENMENAYRQMWRKWCEGKA